VVADGNYAFVAEQAYMYEFNGGLRIWDISNPTALTEAGVYEMTGSASGVAVEGNYAYFTDWDSGLRILDISNLASPTSVGFYEPPGDTLGVAVAGSYAYIAARYSGLRIVDVSNLTAPTLASIYIFGTIPITQVMIDIKPGTDVNSLNIGSLGVTPVAVLTTSDFDASIVDPVSVSFADAAPLRWTLEDVDGDGDDDLMFHFKTQELNLDANSTEAILTGSTFDGTLIEGIDSLNIVPKDI
jgi:hypothetical protein